MLTLRETLSVEAVTESDEVHALRDMITVLVGYLDLSRAWAAKGDSVRCDRYARASWDQAQHIENQLNGGLAS